MEDFERYADDNEITDVPAGKGKTIVVRVVCCLLVFALFLFIGRLILSDYYPKEARVLHHTSYLDGFIDKGSEVCKQKIRFPYDDFDLDENNSNQLRNFSTAHLFVCRDAEELQISVKMNKSTLEKISKFYGIPLDECDYSRIEFRIEFRLEDKNDYVYSPSYRRDFDYAMYNASKLCFNGVDFSKKPAWIRLVISFSGQSEPYSYALIYEDPDQNEEAKPLRVYKRA